jgi:uncharacterized protein (TIGR02466 family)
MERRLDSLFAVPIAVVELDDLDCQSIIAKAEETVEWRPTTPGPRSLCLQSKNLSVLSDFPELRETLLSETRIYADQVLRSPSAGFALTTSWFTKTLPTGSTELHRHRNSWISGCLYFDGGPDHGRFAVYGQNPAMEGIMVRPDEYNESNAVCYEYDTAPGKLILFPSNLQHKITLHNTMTPRYSLAFNTYPTGLIGFGDSCVSITVDDVELELTV